MGSVRLLITRPATPSADRLQSLRQTERAKSSFRLAQSRIVSRCIAMHIRNYRRELFECRAFFKFLFIMSTFLIVRKRLKDWLNVRVCNVIHKHSLVSNWHSILARGYKRKSNAKSWMVNTYSLWGITSSCSRDAGDALSSSTKMRNAVLSITISRTMFTVPETYSTKPGQFPCTSATSPSIFRCSPWRPSQIRRVP